MAEAAGVEQKQEQLDGDVAGHRPHRAGTGRVGHAGHAQEQPCAPPRHHRREGHHEAVHLAPAHEEVAHAGRGESSGQDADGDHDAEVHHERADREWVGGHLDGGGGAFLHSASIPLAGHERQRHGREDDGGGQGEHGEIEGGHTSRSGDGRGSMCVSRSRDASARGDVPHALAVISVTPHLRAPPFLPRAV